MAKRYSALEPMLDKLLRNVLHVKINIFYFHAFLNFYHEEPCTVVHIPLILMEITFSPFPWRFNTNKVKTPIIDKTIQWFLWSGRT